MTALPHLAGRIVGLIHSLSDKGGLTVEVERVESNGGKLITLTRDASVMRYSPQLSYSPQVTLYFAPNGSLELIFINKEIQSYQECGGLVCLAELVRVFNVLVSTNFTFRVISVKESIVQAEMYGKGYPYTNKVCAMITADQESGLITDIRPLM